MITNRRFSLWLIPNEPHMSELKAEQARILKSANPVHLPSFDPHVTLIGGIEICECCSDDNVNNFINDTGIDIDEEAAKIVLQRLQYAFQGFGDVTCEFVEKEAVRAMFNQDGTVKWNQACVSIIRKTDIFMDAMKRANDTLFGTSKKQKVERHFRAPVSEPHYSFIYTDDSNIAKKIAETLKCPPAFGSSKIAMMWTDPPTLEAVLETKWRYIGSIDLNDPKS